MDTSPNLRAKVHKALRKIYIIEAFTNTLTSEKIMHYSEMFKKIETLPRRDLQINRKQIEKRANSLSSLYGFKGNFEELEYFVKIFLKKVNEKKVKAYMFFPKYSLAEFFANYGKAFPGFDDLSPHSRIGLDFFGIREDRFKVEVFIVEACLFEDMAILWNETYELHNEIIINKHIEPIKKKKRSALMRSTAKAAYSFLEGYLNGMALDILLTQEVSEKDEIKLKEFDTSKKKKRYLTLRDKILQYPKIAVGAESPIFDENNLPQLDVILATEKFMRNLVVHPKPTSTFIKDNEFEEDKEPESWKDLNVSHEHPFFSLNTDAVSELCDIVVDVVFKINQIAGRP